MRADFMATLSSLPVSRALEGGTGVRGRTLPLLLRTQITAPGPDPGFRQFTDSWSETLLIDLRRPPGHHSVIFLSAGQYFVIHQGCSIF